MKNSYYNTTNESGQELNDREDKAQTQEQKILTLFIENPTKLFTPFEVQHLTLRNAPITSIRRALTNLTSDGRLIKSEVLKQEKYGAKNFCWKLNYNLNDQKTLF